MSTLSDNLKQLKAAVVPSGTAGEIAEPEKRCPVCQGMKFVTKKVPVGHPDFGKSFPCTACGYDEELKQRRFARLFANSGLMRAQYSRYELASYVSEAIAAKLKEAQILSRRTASPESLADRLGYSDVQRARFWAKIAALEMEPVDATLPGPILSKMAPAIVAALGFAAGEPMRYSWINLVPPSSEEHGLGGISDAPRRSWIVMTGENGTGKTCLAAAAIRQRARTQRGSALIVEYRSIMDQLMASRWEDEESMQKAMSDVDTLMIDDLGDSARDASGNTEFAEATGRRRLVERVLNERYVQGRPTIITTNLPFGDIIRQFGWYVVDRLVERALFVPLDFENGTWLRGGV